MATVAAGQKIRASYFNIPTVAAPDAFVASGTTTSTTFTNTLTTTGIQGVVFTANYFGQAIVIFEANASNNTLGKFALISCEIRTGSSIGSGTVFATSDESTAPAASSDPGTQVGQLTGVRLITGMTPGTVYNACITYRVDANTGTYGRRNITVQPVF